MNSSEIAMLIGGYRYTFPDEQGLQDGIERVLTGAGVTFQREAQLSVDDRIDFLIQCGIGLEVKVQGRPADVTRQLHRYAQHDSITALVLVTSRMQLARVPKELNGKRVDVVRLMGSIF